MLSSSSPSPHTCLLFPYFWGGQIGYKFPGQLIDVDFDQSLTDFNQFLTMDKRDGLKLDRLDADEL